MSKLNVCIAASLAVVVVAAVSAAQVPPARADAPSVGALHRSGASPNPVTNPAPPADVGRTNAERTPSPGQVTASATEPAPGASVPSAPPMTPVAATQSVSTPDAGSTSGSEAVPRAEVTSSGSVSIGSDPAIPGRTYSHRFTGTVDVANVLWRSGRAYDLFSDRDASWRFGIGIGYDVLRLPESLVFALEAGFLHEPAHGDDLEPVAGGLSGSLSASTIHLGPSLRWELTPWLAPYGRLQLLATSTTVDITAGGSYPPMSWTHQKWSPGASCGLGVMANLPPRNPVNVGLLIEGGIWLQRGFDLQLERELPRDAIATAGARIGALENTGPYLRVAGVLRF